MFRSRAEANAASGRRAFQPAELAVKIQREMSTQFGFGALLNELGQEKSELVARILLRRPT